MTICEELNLTCFESILCCYSTSRPGRLSKPFSAAKVDMSSKAVQLLSSSRFVMINSYSSLMADRETADE